MILKTYDDVLNYIKNTLKNDEVYKFVINNPNLLKLKDRYNLTVLDHIIIRFRTYFENVSYDDIIEFFDTYIHFITTVNFTKNEFIFNHLITNKVFNIIKTFEHILDFLKRYKNYIINLKNNKGDTPLHDIGKCSL